MKIEYTSRYLKQYAEIKDPRAKKETDKVERLIGAANNFIEMHKMLDIMKYIAFEAYRIRYSGKPEYRIRFILIPDTQNPKEKVVKLQLVLPREKYEKYTHMYLDEDDEKLGMMNLLHEMSFAAHHGTPHEFDIFSTEKVGSGESSQWFGWGIYFTDSKSIADSYSKSVPELLNQKNKGTGKFFLRGEYVGWTNEIGGITLSVAQLQKVLFKQDNLLFYPLQDLIHKMEFGLKRLIDGYIVWISREDVERTFNNYNNQHKNDSEQWTQNPNELQRLKDIFVDTLSQIEPQDFVFKENKITKSNRYDVTLHKGKTPDQYDYLSWYDLLTSQQKQKIVNQIKTEKLRKNTFFILKPVDEENEVQPKFFKNISDAKQYMKNWNRQHIIKAFNIPYDQLGLISGTFSIEDLNSEVKDFYTQLSGLLGSPKEASMFLLRSGIDGIKYPSNTIAGGESKGVNYVVFDSKSVTIDVKNNFEL